MAFSVMEEFDSSLERPRATLSNGISLFTTAIWEARGKKG